MSRRAKPSNILAHAFFSQNAEAVARELVGKILVRMTDEGVVLRVRIVETEAYVGTHDLACHAAKGRTRRTEALFGPAGRAYVYFVYGMHFMLNVVTGEDGQAQGVLLRAAELLDGTRADLSGPAKLARHLHITRDLYGWDLTIGQKLYVEDAPAPARLARAPRVGVDYAKDWTHTPLRFYDPDSAAVSRRPKLTVLVNN